MADDTFIITDKGERPVPRHEHELRERRFSVKGWWKWGVALLSLCLFSGLLWYAYIRGVEEGGGPVRTVQADPEPFKVKPDDPGGLQVPDQEKLVFKEAVGRPDESEEALGAPPETPMPKPEPVIVDVAPPKPAPAPTPKPAEKPLLQAEQKPVSKPAPKPEPKPETKPKPEEQAVLSRPPASRLPEPASEPAPPSSPPAEDAPLSLPPGAGVRASTLAAADKVDVPQPLAGDATGVMVQLESLSSVDAAKSAWAQIQPRYPDILVSRNAKVEQAQISGRTVYRLMVGPYANRDEADKVCDLLKSRGRDCFIVLP